MSSKGKYWFVLVLALVLVGCAVDWSQWRTMQDGKEFELGSTLVCCSCGLVHNVTYRIEGDKVFVKMWRNKWLTAERREHLQDVNE